VIVRELVEGNRNIKLKTQWTNGYMDFTGTVSIYKFNCNNFFSFRNSIFERYFPRYNIGKQSSEQVLEATYNYLTEQAKWLSTLDKKLYLSLTGGVDSKVSLSLLKPLKLKLSLFTYLIDFDNVVEGPRKEIYLKDKEIVNRLTYNFDLNHKFFRFEELDIPRDFSKHMKQKFTSSHSTEVAYLVREYMEKNSLHIKSNIYELAKFPYPKAAHKLTDIEDGYSITSKWLPKSLRDKKHKGNTMYKESAQRTNFTRDKLKDANLGMMLYFESKLSNWHSNITQETDIIQDTFILFNSKYLIRQLLSLSLGDRLETKLLHLYIEKSWPFLNYQIANSYSTLDQYKNNETNIMNQDNSLSLNSVFNVSTKVLENGFVIQPAYNIQLKDDMITFDVQNNTNEDMILTIKGDYTHPEKNIFVVINSKKMSINHIFEGLDYHLKSKGVISFEIEYKKNFKYKSWYNAGRFTITKK